MQQCGNQRVNASTVAVNSKEAWGEKSVYPVGGRKITDNL